MSQVTKFKIFTKEDVNIDIVPLIERLSNLKDPSVIANDFDMNLETYLRIVDLVRARPDKSQLNFRAYARCYHFNDLSTEFQRNRHIVS